MIGILSRDSFNTTNTNTNISKLTPALTSHTVSSFVRDLLTEKLAYGVSTATSNSLAHFTDKLIVQIAVE
jgi:hypothetical protein